MCIVRLPGKIAFLIRLSFCNTLKSANLHFQPSTLTPSILSFVSDINEYIRLLFIFYCIFHSTQTASTVDILLTLFTIIIICGVLIALQFPIVMSSPLTALAFAILITVSLGSVAAKVATTLAPLPIFALILVSNHDFA